MRTLKASLFSLGLVAALTSSAAAQTVSFDNVTAAPYAFLANGYGGLNWSNAYAMDGVAFFGSAAAAGGFNTGLHSGKYLMSNAGAGDLGISSGSAFNLLGGYFAASWTNGLTVNAVGYHNGTAIYNRSFNLNWSASQYVVLDMLGVDHVVFSNVGGYVDERFNSGSNNSFVVDDLTLGANDANVKVNDIVTQDVVPEPMTIGLVGLGLLAVGGLKMRRKRSV